MTTEITTTKSFQEKMFEKIRESMGDLMSEDDLKAVVNSAMQKAFFEPGYEIDRYGNSKLTKDSLFVNLIRKEMESKVIEAVKIWLVEHPEEVTKAIDETIAKGIFGLIQQHIETVSYAPMERLANDLRSRGIL